MVVIKRQVELGVKRIIRVKIINNNGCNKKTSRIREIKDNTRQNY